MSEWKCRIEKKKSSGVSYCFSKCRISGTAKNLETRQLWRVGNSDEFLLRYPKERKRNKVGIVQLQRQDTPPSGVNLQMRCGWRPGVGGWGHEWVTQWDSPLTELPSPLGEEERESPFSVFSELEPFWLWWSAVDAALDDEAEVDVGLAFSLKSVMMTVRSPTVTSRCWALLRSMFFNLGLVRECRWLGKVRKRHCKMISLKILNEALYLLLRCNTIFRFDSP